MSFLKKLANSIIVELLSNGKMLISYVALLFPAVNQYPMILGAIQKFAAAPTHDNGAFLIAQVLLAFGGSARLFKIIKAVVARMQK